MRFFRLKLENWRNFKAVDIPLQQRAFIVGANASGKSNMLDVFRFLRDIASDGGGLQKAIHDRNGIRKLRCLSARQSSDIAIEVEIGDDENKPTWLYKVRFNQDSQSRPLIKEEFVSRNSTQIIKRPDELDKADQQRLRQTFLEQVNANREFREIADFFAQVRYLHVIPQLLREPHRFLKNDLSRDPYGSDFLEQIARAQPKTRDARLRRIQKALTIAVPNLSELRLGKDALGVPHLEGRYSHWRQPGALQQEDQFSDGTLRLVGLLWAVMDGNGPLLLEEPELNLHPTIVRQLSRLLHEATRKNRRQVLISTHSPDLLAEKSIAPDEVVLLQPTNDGTNVTLASFDQVIRSLVEHGHTFGEAIVPKTSPEHPEQLAFFGK